MTRRFSIVGVPSGVGGCGIGMDETLAALRSAGLVDRLREAGAAVRDLGDPDPRPWRLERFTTSFAAAIAEPIARRVPL